MLCDGDPGRGHDDTGGLNGPRFQSEEERGRLRSHLLALVHAFFPRVFTETATLRRLFSLEHFGRAPFLFPPFPYTTPNTDHKNLPHRNFAGSGSSSLVLMGSGGRKPPLAPRIAGSRSGETRVSWFGLGEIRGRLPRARSGEKGLGAPCYQKAPNVPLL